MVEIYKKRNYKKIKSLYKDLKLIDTSLKNANKPKKLRRVDYEFISLVEHSYMFNVNFYNWCVNNTEIPNPKTSTYRQIDKDFRNCFGKKLDYLENEINGFLEEKLLIDSDNLADNGIVKYLTISDLKNILVSSLSPGKKLRSTIIKQAVENELSIAKQIIEHRNLDSIKRVYINREIEYTALALNESKFIKKLHLKEEIDFITYFTKIMIYLELEENQNNKKENKKKNYSNTDYEQLVFSI